MSYQFGMMSMYMDGLEVACLQNVNIDINYDFAELFCGSSMFPADVRAHSGRIQGNAEFANLHAAVFEKVLGGTRTTTSVAVSNTSTPGSFVLVGILTTDAITLTVTFNKVRSSKLSLPFVRDGHVIPNFDFQCEADDNGNVFTIDCGDVS